MIAIPDVGALHPTGTMSIIDHDESCTLREGTLPRTAHLPANSILCSAACKTLIAFATKDQFFLMRFPPARTEGLWIVLNQRLKELFILLEYYLAGEDLDCPQNHVQQRTFNAGNLLFHRCILMMRGYSE